MVHVKDQNCIVQSCPVLGLGMDTLCSDCILQTFETFQDDEIRVQKWHVWRNCMHFEATIKQRFQDPVPIYGVHGS
ncbi:hypothetical protein QQP08_018258 [Theobroma cacao]|nr:hypothetical protein QQP08_018258 [Theobroma cacao]